MGLVGRRGRERVCVTPLHMLSSGSLLGTTCVQVRPSERGPMGVYPGAQVAKIEENSISLLI